jgi:hypothetical protein
MPPNEISVIDAPLVQRADRYREEAERQRQQEDAKRVSDQASQVARVQHEQAAVVWTRAYADDYVEAQRQKREKLARDEELERELKRMRFERMYIPAQPMGHISDPWWRPFVEMLKIIAPIVIATAPLWIPPLVRHFRRSPQGKKKLKRRKKKRLLRMHTKSLPPAGCRPSRMRWPMAVNRRGVG